MTDQHWQAWPHLDTSLRARVLTWVVRQTIRPRLGAMSNIERVRKTFNLSLFPQPRGVEYESGSVGGVPGEWVRPRAGAAGLKILYIHGGGFIACSPKTHRPVTGAFARRGFTVFVPDYRLAPEHPFPAAIDDAVAVWRSFAAEGPAFVVGDSAGGNLALVLMVRARDESLPAPLAAVLFSPWTDLLGTGTSHKANAKRDALFSPVALRQVAATYLGAADPSQPFASPLYADLTGLPPLLIHCSVSELLRDDAIQLAAKAQSVGVRVSLNVFPVVGHVWQFAHSVVPEARRSLDEAASFLRQAFKSSSAATEF